MTELLGVPFVVFIIFFILFIILLRWYGSKHWIVIIVLAYWISFIVFVILITEECNVSGDSLGDYLQTFILVTVLLVLIIFTLGTVHLGLNVCI
jgi:hypothetical protein